jgi:uncharacterized protein (TIGR02594 family)
MPRRSSICALDVFRRRGRITAKDFQGMKIGPATALLALCSIASFAAPARADVNDGRQSADVISYGMSSPGPRFATRQVDRHYVGRRHVARYHERHRIHEDRTATRRVPHERRVAERHIHAIPQTARNAMAAVDRVGSPTGSGVSRFGGGSLLVAEARRYIGGNPTGRSSLWCARFMNFVLKKAGFAGTSSDMASSFASYGHRISGPRVGAIAVMSRGRRGGHVGVVSGFDSRGNPIVISGNHGHRVAESTYSRGRIYAYVMP